MSLDFGEREVAPAEILGLALHWHLGLGESLQIQFGLDTENERQALLSEGGFLTVEQLRVASFNHAFLLPAGASGSILSSSVDSPAESRGRAEVLVGVVPRHLDGSQVLRVTVVVF